MSVPKLSKCEFFVLGQLLRAGKSYVYEIALAASTTLTYPQSDKAVGNALEQLRSKGLVQYVGLEESSKGPARRYWKITEDGEQAFRNEYGNQLKDLVSLYPL